MAPTLESRRAVFRDIAQRPYANWPVYDTSPLYDRTSLAGLESDVRTVSETWFGHKSHDSVEQLVCSLPMAYFQFNVHDRYEGSTRYEMDTLFRMFVLKELHGWEHETALAGYLGNAPVVCDQLGVEAVPDQSALWRSWNTRFTAELRETVGTTARTLLIRAQNAEVSVPRDPERNLCYRDSDDEGSAPDEQRIPGRAETITERVSRVVFPAVSLDRGTGREIHQNASWGLETYLGLRENLAANGGARSFVYESTRERTPLGQAHRDHLRDLSIPEVRAMYRRAIRQLIGKVAKAGEVPRAGIVAIDITEADPFRGDRTGHEDEIIGRRRTPTSTPASGPQSSWSVTLFRSSPMLAPWGKASHARRSSRSCWIRLRTSFTSIMCEWIGSSIASMSWGWSASVGSPTSSRNGCRPARRPRPSGCSSGIRTDTRPTANSIRARMSGTRRP